MKPYHLFTIGVLCCALLFNARAQPPLTVQKLLPEKTLLFSKLPEKLSINNLWIEKLFEGPDSGSVKIPLTSTTFFEGEIVERVQKNPHVISINVKSSNYDKALLSISKITYNDRTVKYIGRIVSINYGDVMLLTQENNTLSFKRKKQNLVITE